MKHFLFKVSSSSTTVRTLIFTLGHFLIDTMVIAKITGADLQIAGQAAVVGPLINGVWYWLIDRWWTMGHMETEHQSEFKK